jgi:hypothetical protein
LASEWSKALNVNVRSAEKLGTLIVATALRRNAGGCALYSSRNAARLQNTVSSIARGQFSQAQCTLFESLVLQAKELSESTSLAGAA